ncbi:SURF1 family protein [Roseateles sp. YR242]|uniref:SURF1 family protein n=1 Tax=Roseateles sp. YR242 TaxID=1855305 RepID=UPI0008C2A4B3|nr:SURF1 family protein [Roseateles sp. YR242]SEK58627.1 SURF1 family protein [Roseateles sp. YR242]
MLVATLLGVVVAAALGTWQLDRAAQKIALQQALTLRGNLAPLATGDLPSADDPPAEALLHRRASLQGRWDPDPRHTVYLDNRPMDGRVGFLVLTLFQLTGRSEALLVQRGWVPRDAANREHLPALINPQGDVRIEGRLAGAPSRAFELGTPVKAGPIRQNVELSAFQDETGLRLLPLVLLETDGPSSGTPSADGLLRHWPPPAVDVHKHYGYAFQWFALGALILGLYVWFQVLAPLRRDRRRRDSPDADAA